MVIKMLKAVYNNYETIAFIFNRGSCNCNLKDVLWTIIYYLKWKDKGFKIFTYIESNALFLACFILFTMNLKQFYGGQIFGPIVFQQKTYIIMDHNNGRLCNWWALEMNNNWR